MSLLVCYRLIAVGFRASKTHNSKTSKFSHSPPQPPNQTMTNCLDPVRLRSVSILLSQRVEAFSPHGESVLETSYTLPGPSCLTPSLSSINSVCYFCLKKITLTEFKGQSVAFCSQECEGNAKVFYDVETKADWLSFDDYCWNQGLKYPLMVRRLACMVISGAASDESLDTLQPANLSHEKVLEMEEGFGMLRSSFAEANIADEQMAFLTKQWYNNVLAWIHINAFRIELAIGLYEDLLSSAAACINAEAVGNAVYILLSFYNHDCYPNTHIIWVENANARLKALRDIDADEELRICYIDASMDHDARQTILLQGFGFKCNCLRCLSGD